MKPKAELDAVIRHKLVWKSAKMDAYVTALLQSALALREGEQRINFFNNDDVPEHAQPQDKTTVGTVFGLLLRETIIEPYRGSHKEKKIWGGFRASTRPECNGHRNQLYTLNPPLARAWLKRHGVELGAGVQMDLFPAALVPAPPVCV